MRNKHPILVVIITALRRADEVRRCPRALVWQKITLSLVVITAAVTLHSCGGSIDNALPQGYSVYGRLVTLDNPQQGVSGARVALYSRSRANAQPLQTTITNSNGEYYFVNIPSGDYIFAAQTSDGTYRPVRFSLSLNQAMRLDLSLIPSNAAVSEIRIEAPPPGPPGPYVVGNQYQFKAYAKRKDLDTDTESEVEVSPRWSVTNGVGTINSLGQFTATSAGTGQIVATLYDNDTPIEARIDIIVKDDQQDASSARLIVPVSRHGSNDNMLNIYLQSGQSQSYIPLGRLYPEKLSTSRNGIMYCLDKRAGLVFRVELSTKRITVFFNVPRDSIIISELPEDRVLLVTNNGRFYLYNGLTGQPLSEGRMSSISKIFDIVYGPDGKIYFACQFRENGLVRNGILRYAVEHDYLVFDRVLVSSGTVTPVSIGFTSNNDMIVCEGATIRRYTAEGVPLEGGFVLPTLETPKRLRVSQGVPPSDDLLFVLTNSGIWRIQYSGGAGFELIPKDKGAPFLSGRYADFSVW